jgi:hypothetical protein
VVRSLNDVLTGALKRLMPPGADISNNTLKPSGGVYGGPGVSFSRTRNTTGGELYVASIRIRDGSTPYNLLVQLEAHGLGPVNDRCSVDHGLLSNSLIKGVVTVEWRQSTGDGGAVFRLVTAHPYGSGEYAKIILQQALVEVYRPGGEVVHINFDPVIETEPAHNATGILPMNLSTDQLVGIASLPELTVN